MDPELRILIIDDDEQLRLRIARMLRYEMPGARFGLAGTVNDGLALANQGDWHVIILDIRLPDGNGLSAMPELRLRSPRAAIIVTTGLAGLPYTDVVAQLGGVGFVVKEDLADRLLDLIRAAIAPT